MIKIDDDLISLETENTGYYLGKRGNLWETLHYGAKIHPDRLALTEKIDSGYGTDVVYREDMGKDALLHLSLDLSPTHKGDYRQTALDVTLANGSSVCDWTFVSAQINEGTWQSEELPFAHEAEQHLVMTYTGTGGLQVDLVYSVFPEADVITRRMILTNAGQVSVILNRALSYQLDLPNYGYQLSTFTGAWARERHESVRDLTNGRHAFGSSTGTSSHYCNPFFMIYQEHATEETGAVYGFNLIYSGNHFGQVEVGPYQKMRIMAGIQDDGFSWTLDPGQSFESPEAMLTFSKAGKNGMSQNCHNFVKHHIVSKNWASKERPILLNNWEATYFDFNQRKLLKLAKEAKDVGIELFVLDDGWFGQRNSDTEGLGDYDVNLKKLPSGLAGLAKQINKLGLDFGIWIEPEMVSVKSKLYQEHPDWAISSPGIEPSLGRHQLVLDLCRPEVQDYIIEQINKLLSSANISYVKWDMNRHLSDIFSPSLSNQGQFYHSWVKGLYRILRDCMAKHPDILFEGCSNGGNRFDLGMLCYFPQIWTSDNTDVYERMKIQTGTSYGYPQSTMSCHVSDVPNHQTLRNSPIESRFDVASFGILGYELDVTKLPSADKKILQAQIAYYKEHRKLLQFGSFYRLLSPFKMAEQTRWLVVAEDKSQAVLMDAIGRSQPNQESLPVRLPYLEADYLYDICNRQEQLDIRQFGSLMNAALPVKVNHHGLAVHVIADHYKMTLEKENYQAYGDLLAHAGIRLNQAFTATGFSDKTRLMPDYGARLYDIIKK